MPAHDTEPCPCGSQKPFAACCAPYLRGEALPETAEALMRSRYTAFARNNVEYIDATMTERYRTLKGLRELRRWNRSVDWSRLTILDTKDGGAGDASGEVEFRAAFERDGSPGEIHERSLFTRIQGRWLYSGEVFSHREGGEAEAPAKPQTVVRQSPKPGRNDPCPCGSGKKFKKCCGA